MAEYRRRSQQTRAIVEIRAIQEKVAKQATAAASELEQSRLSDVEQSEARIEAIEANWSASIASPLFSPEHLELVRGELAASARQLEASRTALASAIKQRESRQAEQSMCIAQSRAAKKIHSANESVSRRENERRTQSVFEDETSLRGRRE